MRMLLIAGLVSLAGGAAAQERVVVRGPGASYPPPGTTVIHQGATPSARQAGPWGAKVDGRWWAGAAAPGGWAAYRRPVRGVALPSYWTGSRFMVGDWAGYGLPEPPAGYRWIRYYDDAVLIDGRGAVYDTQFGVAWDRPYPTGYGVAERRPAPPPPSYGYGAGYPPPDAYGAAFPPPPPLPYGGGYVTPTVQTYTVPAGGSHTVFVGPGVTTVTVSTQPVVTTTTTTTEFRDEAVTYTRPVKPVVRSKVKRR